MLTNTLIAQGVRLAVLDAKAMIVGGWNDGISEGNYGVRLDMPD